jgi:hypothetical protein
MTVRFSRAAGRSPCTGVCGGIDFLMTGRLSVDDSVDSDDNRSAAVSPRASWLSAAIERFPTGGVVPLGRASGTTLLLSLDLDSRLLAVPFSFLLMARSYDDRQGLSFLCVSIYTSRSKPVLGPGSYLCRGVTRASRRCWLPCLSMPT